MKEIALEEFLRSFKVLPAGKFGFFLGSGCSVQSGIPTGGQLVWEFKRTLYCTDHRIAEEKFKDLDLERNRGVLQSYFDQKNTFPKIWSSEEYSHYFQECYKESQHRRMFLRSKVENKKPALGHLCLGTLISKGKINRVFTTNFDDLIEKGISQADPALSFATYSEDNKSFPNHENENIPWVLKLHGDYLYDSLKNTNDELKELENRFHQYLKEYAKTNGLLMAGYSGSDDSILAALEETLTLDKPFPNGFYWVMRKNVKVNDRVTSFLQKLAEKNNLVGIVRVDHFDDFAYDLVNVCGFSNEKLEAGIKGTRKLIPFQLNSASQNEISPIKLNALKAISLPTQMYQFKTDIKAWKELREICGTSKVIAGRYKDSVWCFGDVAEIKSTFKNHVLSEIKIRDIPPTSLKRLNSIELGLIYELIGKALVSDFGLMCKSFKKRIYYSKEHRIQPAYLTECKVHNSLHRQIYEAIEYSIEFIGETPYLVLNPTVFIDSEDKDLVKDTQNRVLSKRYNGQYNDTLTTWLNLFSKKKESIEFKAAGGTCIFSATTSYADVKSSQTVDFFQKIKILPETKLHFHQSDSSYATQHPLKGLQAYGPYDASLGSGASSLRLACICPKAELQKLSNFFNGFNSSTAPVSEKPYLINYSSFSNIFKKGIEFPGGANSTNFADLSVDLSITIEKFYEELKRRIDHLANTSVNFDLLVVYIPDYWSKFREKKNETVYFDLHDSVKIYGAKKGIAIQFLNDKTFDYFDQSKIKWWLSLALYAKSGAIPWVSNGEDSTVYVGLSHSISPNKSITIGMSQVFDPKGRGTRFLVSPVNRPIMIGDTPYMSKEDSRRLIHTLKEAYYRMDSNAQIRKLVIHKLNPFIEQEIEGILQATEGMDVELLHIQQQPAWRGVKGDRVKKGPAPYPVDRGTVIQLDDNSFLLFSHGTISNAPFLNGSGSYFKGARGIPMPLKITRYAGKDSIEKTASELLRLTKMNWNAAELYKNLPVTVDFSKYLSKYSKQDELLLNVPYDYRFFI